MTWRDSALGPSRHSGPIVERSVQNCLRVTSVLGAFGSHKDHCRGLARDSSVRSYAAGPDCVPSILPDLLSSQGSKHNIYGEAVDNLYIVGMVGG